MHFIPREATALVFALLVSQVTAQPHRLGVAGAALSKVKGKVAPLLTPDNMETARQYSGTTAEIIENGAMAYNSLKGNPGGTYLPQNTEGLGPPQY